MTENKLRNNFSSKPLFLHLDIPVFSSILMPLRSRAANYCVFQTTLPIEYAYLAAAAAAKKSGCSENDIKNWLEQFRINGFEYSFLK